MTLEDAGPRGLVGHRQRDDHVEPRRSLGGGVEGLGVVRGGDRENGLAFEHAIERGEEVGQRPVVAIGIAVAEDQVDVVEHDERGAEGLRRRVEFGDHVPHGVGIGEDRRVAVAQFAGDHADEVRFADAGRPGHEHAAVGAQAQAAQDLPAARGRGEKHVHLRPDLPRQDQTVTRVGQRRRDAELQAALDDRGLEHPPPQRILHGLEPIAEPLEHQFRGRLAGGTREDGKFPAPMPVVHEHAEGLGVERASGKERDETPRHRDLVVGPKVEL